jgi:hypothetical protein
MKKSFLITLLSFIILSVAVQAQNYPYKASYSSKFKMGSNDLAKMVLDLYKGYETSDFSKESWFADTVVAQLPNGQVIQGREQVISTFKKEREGEGDVTFDMQAIIPLTSTDRNENWVALWGSSQTSQGKSEFQAIWRINKDKKVDFIKILNANSPQQ